MHGQLNDNLCFFGMIASSTTFEPQTTEAETSTYKSEDSTYAAYHCMDITVEECRDETLDIIDTVSMDSLEDCYTLCSKVFQNVCNSYTYDSDTKICSLLEDHLYYFDGCDKLGAGYESVKTCLEDDIKYPDMCKVSFKV